MWEQELGEPKKTDPAEECGKKCQADLWGMEEGGGRVAGVKAGDLERELPVPCLG